MAESTANESGVDSDQDFDPTAEMLVNDFDDEQTIDQEEAMEASDNVTDELDDLQREGEMPLEELLASYGYGSNPQEEEEEDADQEPPEQISDSSVVNLSEPTREGQDIGNQSPHSSDSNSSPSDEVIYLSTTNSRDSSKFLLRSVKDESDSSDSDAESHYTTHWRKTIHVGSDFQATVPEGLSEYDESPVYENEDRLLWDPTRLPDDEVEEYLRQTRQVKSENGTGINAIPTGSHVRDDEKALYLLMQCEYNIEEALRRKSLQPPSPTDTFSWSEDECRNFEAGLKTYGKDFHLIRMNKVKTNAVGELVQFYYFWKKSERHDVFASKNRVEKKKYTLHPGTTDYMDRFIEQQEKDDKRKERSPSPTSHSPVSQEMKQSTSLTSPEANTDSSTSELSVHVFDHLEDGPLSASSNGTASASIEQENSSSTSQSDVPSVLTIRDARVSSPEPVLCIDEGSKS